EYALTPTVQSSINLTPISSDKNFNINDGSFPFSHSSASFLTSKLLSASKYTTFSPFSQPKASNLNILSESTNKNNDITETNNINNLHVIKTLIPANMDDIIHQIKLRRLKIPPPRIDSFLSKKSRRKSLIQRPLPEIPKSYKVVFYKKPYGFWIETAKNSKE